MANLDYIELQSHTAGRLFFARHGQSDLPRGYFQPRFARPHTLRVSDAPAWIGVRPPKPKSSTKLLLVRKLATSREHAKRLLGFLSSSPSSSSRVDLPATSEVSRQQHRLSGTGSVSSERSGSTSATGLAPEMASGIGVRNGHGRSNSGVGGPASGMLHRAALAESVRTASELSNRSARSNSTGTSGAFGDEKPLAAGNGVSVYVSLAEPALFLQGYDQHDLTNRTTTLLRGSLRLRVTKSAKIKAITLAFRGRAETEWPEGIPPRKLEFKDTESIMNHTWPFFNAQFQTAELGHGADRVTPLKAAASSTKEISITSIANPTFDHFQRASRACESNNLSSNDAKRLSLQVNRSRSFGRGDSDRGSGPTIAQKGYRTFTPGDYTYSFELPIDSRLPESINVELGGVKYELEALVERAGAFRANLVGTKEVTLIRVPSENSLEQVEPIAISRNWEDQLHYDIVISGKSFPLGAQVPIAFKLTPLAKVQCHRIKVYITENIHYYTANKRVHRLEPTRKVQLFEKRADAPSTSAYPGSTVRITAGGGIAYDGREAAARGDETVPRDPTNLLGDLEGGHSIGPTEMEFSVQLPSCPSMKDRDKSQQIHFDTTYANIQVHHWIKIVLRLSKPDSEDPSKRRHFEISIDSPFNILSCRATQANTALPAYTSPEAASFSIDHYQCGCPGARLAREREPSLNTLDTYPSNSSSTTLSNSLTNSSSSSGGSPTRPQAAYLPDDHSVNRPIHLLRQASFNPPAFSDVEDPPPPLMTPPPNYDTIADPRSGLADYFARLADEIGDEDDTMLRIPSRVDVPLTPGARINRSMDERRTWLPVGQQ
ncbi:MAG: hypothetical protein MMC33_009422 [Icmadophila ericetorum]|nr:hypothetical protein [Icmadophila ericetorum]